MISGYALSGDIFEEHAVLDVEQLSRLCAVETHCIVEFVEEGVLSVLQLDVPAGADARNWRFDGAALQRARAALRLQQDLAINLPGIALVLELKSEIERLRRELGHDR